MADRMDALIVAAVRQGFRVSQTRTGFWIFSRNITTLIFRQPRTPREWMYMINGLRGAGLRFPESR